MKKALLLLLGIFFTLSCYTQVTIKHFNAGWNNANKVLWLSKLTDCNVKYYDISKSPSLQSKYKVIVIPTIIIFQDGEEIKRFQADISFKMPATKSEVQEAIDEAIMGGF
jgi:thiol-disulfide isomerase/thioredoxin